MTEDVPGDLTNILGPNEQIQLYVEQRMYHPTLYVDSVAITTQRIILRHPHALGLKKEYTDFGYQDIANVVLERGVLRSTVKCMLRFGGEPLALADLPNAEAEKAYGIIRENLSRFQGQSMTGQVGSLPMRQEATRSGTSSASVCPKCGGPTTLGQKFCTRCGTAL
jgi:hypothetical protein